MPYLIYELKNTVNDKVYVGFTSQTLKKRWKKHVNDAKVGRKTILCNAIRKYGSEVFERKVLFISDDLEAARDVAENTWIKEKNSHYLNGHGYNMTFGGEGTMGHKHSPESIEKMRKVHTGKKHSEKTKSKLSEQRKGAGNPNFGRVFSDEYKQKISKVTKGANNPRAKQYLITLPDSSQTITKDRKGFCDEHQLNYWSVRSATDRGHWHKGYFFEVMDKKDHH